MSILNALLSTPMAAVTSGPSLISLAMGPSVKRGDFASDEEFQLGQSELGLGEFFTNQNFNQGFVSGAPTPVNESLVKGGILDATPIFASEDIASRNVGVPQDNRFTGIMRNFARPLMFQGGVKAGLTLGEIATGAANIPLALAGGIASQFLPLDRRPSNLDYQYVNDPNNMGGLRVVDNKIIDPSGILQGKNFASAFGSNSLATMYDKAISKFDERIGKLEEEEELTKAQQRRLDRLIGRRQIAKNRLEDFLAAGGNIPGTNITRNQFAYDYNRGIGQFAQPDYDALDTQSYESLGGGEQTTTVDGQDITSYSDPYDPGTDD